MRARYEKAGPLAPRIETAETLTVRLRRGLAEAGLDCACREKADAVLDGFDAEQRLRQRGGALAQARNMRDAIVLVLALLGEVDEIAPDEPDLSAFAELASLFDDAAEFASAGAEAMRGVVKGATPIPATS